MDIVARIAEQKIREAMEQGAFDQLKNKGKPLQFEDDQGVPAELKAAYKILKNSGCLPAELELRKECVNLAELIACCDDEATRARYQRDLHLKRLKLEMMLEREGKRLSGPYAVQAFARFEES